MSNRRYRANRMVGRRKRLAVNRTDFEADFVDPFRSVRRAAMYIAVLGSVMVVTVIGLSAIWLARIERMANSGLDNLAAARFCAQNGIEFGFHQIATDINWRTNRGAGAWANLTTFNDCTFTLEVAFKSDGDADPGNNPAVLTCTGLVGDARHKMQVTVEEQGGGYAAAPGSWLHIGT